MTSAFATLKTSFAKTLAAREAFTSPSPERTLAIGKRTARRLPADGAVFLYGELGAGKTLFARGLASGLGVDPQEVSSPTFVIMAEYPGPATVHHVDLYRIEHASELDEIGFDEVFLGPGIKIVEWAEKLDPEDYVPTVAVFLDVLPDDTRKIEIFF